MSGSELIIHEEVDLRSKAIDKALHSERSFAVQRFEESPSGTRKCPREALGSVQRKITMPPRTKLDRGILSHPNRIPAPVGRCQVVIMCSKLG